MTPEHKAWREERAQEFLRHKTMSHKPQPYSQITEHFLAGMEAEHEVALLVGYIRALKFAISYTDHCYEGLGAELKLNEKALADLLAKGRG